MQLTEHQNGVLLLNVLLQKVLEFMEAAKPVIALLCRVSLVPVVDLVVSFVVVRKVGHISVFCFFLMEQYPNDE